MSQSIGIVGGGALGTLFAAALAPHYRIHLVVRTEADVDIIRARGGVSIDAAHAYAVDVTTNIRELANVAVLFVAVKTFDTQTALAPLGPLLDRESIVVSFQNGVDNDARIRAAGFTGESIILAPTSEAAIRIAPGIVKRVGVGSTTIGFADNAPAGDVADVLDCFRSGGFAARIVEDIDAHVWAKLIINAAINPVTALWNATNDIVLRDHQAHERAAAIAREAMAVAVALGIDLPFDDPVAAFEAVARTTTTNRSSMLNDFSRGGPTEIDAINGAVVAHGTRLGIPTPVNAEIVAEIAARSAKRG